MHTLNLLPANRRVHLRREIILLSSVRLGRAVLIGMIVLTVGGVATALGFWIGSFTLVSSSEVELSLSVQEYQEIDAEVNGQNGLLETVDRLGRERTVWSEVLKELESVITPGTIITSIQTSADTNTLDLSGTSPTRSALVIFTERLWNVPWITNVQAPSSNLLESDRPEFVLGITVDPTQFGEE